MAFKTIFNCVNEQHKELFVGRFKDKVYITIEHEDCYTEFYMDKSTAIKLSKTLRTEINKIQDL